MERLSGGSRVEAFKYTFTDVEPLKEHFYSSGTSNSTFQKVNKRPRARTDVEGEDSGDVGRKKRRLRLDLVTSRLSKPYAIPSTYIVGRGPSKIAAWAKQKVPGRSLLRKAAILNRIRRTVCFSEDRQSHSDILRDQSMYSPMHFSSFEAFAEAQRQPPVVETPRPEIPLPPSPFGLSDYDVFDQEDFCDTEPDDDGYLIYSDFNILEPTEPEIAEEDLLGGVDGFASRQVTVPALEEKATEIKLEQERQKEISFVYLGY
ncbi:MAG: hypothetical protein M1834_004751 [Cirrosporium novae-zelandiae]|nr:MAG: hypothetical protein M1834_004751 [Cirrosporium novae-zelandiae]